MKYLDAYMPIYVYSYMLRASADLIVFDKFPEGVSEVGLWNE